MLEKLKDIMHANEEIDSVKKELIGLRSSFGKDIGAMKATLASLSHAWSIAQRDVEGHIAQAAKAHKDLSSVLATVQAMKDSFEEELNELKLLKGRLHKTMMADVKDELKGDIEKVRSSLLLESDSLAKLRRELLSLGDEVRSIVPEVTKLKEISNHIKRSDYDLNKYALRLDDSNKEKLDLLRKIDALQRIISRERRR